jgi:hypothetical protein
MPFSYYAKSLLLSGMSGSPLWGVPLFKYGGVIPFDPLPSNKKKEEDFALYKTYVLSF